jgi:hypothetical protein
MFKKKVSTYKYRFDLLCGEALGTVAIDKGRAQVGQTSIGHVHDLLRGGEWSVRP